MGNLGPYQDIVTEAKRLGSVEKLIETIEKAAVAKAIPKAFAAGAAVTALSAAGAVAILRRVSERAKTREALADEAKAWLRIGFEEAQRPEESSEVTKAEEHDDQDGSLEDGSSGNTPALDAVGPSVPAILGYVFRHGRGRQRASARDDAEGAPPA